MDILYHSLVGGAIARGFSGAFGLSGPLFAILPDVLGAMPFQYFKILHAVRAPRRGFISDILSSTTSRVTFYGQVDKIAYRTTHSWFMLIPVGLVAYGIAKDGWWILTISYFSHLLIDLFTHEKEFAQRPLYPVSDFHVEGKNWATNSSVYFFFWALFISAVVVFLQFGGR